MIAIAAERSGACEDIAAMNASISQIRFGRGEKRRAFSLGVSRPRSEVSGLSRLGGGVRNFVRSCSVPALRHDHLICWLSSRQPCEECRTDGDESAQIWFPIS